MRLQEAQERLSPSAKDLINRMLARAQAGRTRPALH